jgi:RNA polymerase sigma-70 factor, ECF subfamily
MQTAVRLPMLSAMQARTSVKATSDETLIDSIARGDKRAMELLFARHNVRVYRFIARLSGNLSLAEDVVSEVFLDVWRCAGRFKGHSRVSTWLLAIARHKAITALRRHSEAQWDEDKVAAIADDAEDPETSAHGKGRSAIIQTCLMQLSPAQRQVIDLVYYHEKTIAEVAAITGIPEGTVKTRMLRARGRLAELLKVWRIQGVQAN